MRSLTHILPSISNKFGHRLMMVFIILCICSWTAVCLGASYLEEEKFDRAAGILDREWRINLIRMATRDYLRLRSQVKTGLPNYDQLVENTRLAPAALYEQLTAKPVGPAPSAPQISSLPPKAIESSPAPQQAPSGSIGGQQAPSASQAPPSPPTNISTSPTTPLPPLPDLSPPTVTLPPGAPTPTFPPPTSPGPSVTP